MCIWLDHNGFLFYYDSFEVCLFVCLKYHIMYIIIVIPEGFVIQNTKLFAYTKARCNGKIRFNVSNIICYNVVCSDDYMFFRI